MAVGPYGLGRVGNAAVAGPGMGRRVIDRWGQVRAGRIGGGIRQWLLHAAVSSHRPPACCQPEQPSPAIPHARTLLTSLPAGGAPQGRAELLALQRVPHGVSA